MNNPDPARARALAEALEKNGMVSVVPESDPNPIWAAQQAFYVCNGRKTPNDWREYNESLSEQSVPPHHRHWKLGRLCYRALRHPAMRDDLREAIAFAWGYFVAKLPAGMR